MSNSFEKKELLESSVNGGRPFSESDNITSDDVNAIVSGILKNTDDLKKQTYSKSETDDKFYSKAESQDAFAVKSDVFNKAEALGTFAAKSDVFTKDEAAGVFAPADNVYDKESAENIFASKSDVYAKIESDRIFSKITDTYGKSEADNLFAAKSDVYSKSQADNEFVNKTDNQLIHGKKIFSDIEIQTSDSNSSELNVRRYVNFDNVNYSHGKYAYTMCVERDSAYLLRYDTAKDVFNKIRLSNERYSYPLSCNINGSNGDVFVLYLSSKNNSVSELCVGALRSSDNLFEHIALPQDFALQTIGIHNNILYALSAKTVRMINCDTLKPLTTKAQSTVIRGYELKESPKNINSITIDANENVYYCDGSNQFRYENLSNGDTAEISIQFNCHSISLIGGKIILFADNGAIYEAKKILTVLELTEITNFTNDSFSGIIALNKITVTDSAAFMLLKKDNTFCSVIEYNAEKRTVRVIDEQIYLSETVDHFLFNGLKNISYTAYHSGSANAVKYYENRRLPNTNIALELDRIRDAISETVTEIPSTVSAFINDKQYQTYTDVYNVLDTKLQEVGGKLTVKGRVDKTSDLPADASVGDVYFVGDIGGDKLTRYVYSVDSQWRDIGELSNNGQDFNLFVTKEEGKGLSECDFTSVEKEKLASLSENGGSGGNNSTVVWEGRIREDVIWSYDEGIENNSLNRHKWIVPTPDFSSIDNCSKGDRIVIHMETDPVTDSYGKILYVDEVKIEYEISYIEKIKASRMYADDLGLEWSGEDFDVTCISADCTCGKISLNYSDMTGNSELNNSAVEKVTFAQFGRIEFYHNFLRIMQKIEAETGEQLTEFYKTEYGDSNESLRINYSYSMNGSYDSSCYWNYNTENNTGVSAVRYFQPFSSSNPKSVWINKGHNNGMYYFTKIEVIRS